MTFYKLYNFPESLNQAIEQNPEWQHEVVGFSSDGTIYTQILVKWSPKTKPAEEFKHEQ